MKAFKILIVSATVIAMLLACNERNRNISHSSIDNFTDLHQYFMNPPKEYGSAPLYVWNTLITREMIDRTMQDLKDKGFGGVFVHPRPGLITEYISDDWYTLFRYTVEKGKELDMNVWIYDENSYPSGFAGGHVPDQMPESYNQGQGLAMQHVDTLPANISDYFLCLKEENGLYQDITGNVQDEKGKQASYYLFAKTYEGKSPWYGGFSYVDLLYPGVTQKFIQITMDGYKRIAGDEFGKTVPGWFTDEPNIRPPGGIRWTPDLFEVFQQQWGYDLKIHLPSLYEEVGDWKKIRHNYAQTLLQLFIDRFAKPCYDYCEANHLQFTGHYWEHGWPDMGHGTDNMAMYAWHQMPAIDMLFNRFDERSPQAQFGNVRSVKELRSVANQMGYKRTLSETYGGGGWEESFRDFKRLGDWEFVLGVNFLNQHLSHLSISGARKYDYPPVFSDHSPWWSYYKMLNMHYARLSMALSAGEQKNDLLIIEPTTSAWLYYSYHRSNSHLWNIGHSFQEMVTNLEKAQIEYDLGSENIIKDHGAVNKSKFIIGQRAYSKVVIPPLTENLDTATFALLKQFIANGGTVLTFAHPVLVDGAFNNEAESLFTTNKHVIQLDSLTQDIIRQHFVSPEILFDNVQGGNLFHHRRMMKDGQILFLVNSSLSEATAGSLIMNGKDAVEMNTLTGEIVDYPETVTGKQVSFNFRIPPAGSLLLYVFDKKQDNYPLPAPVGNYSPVQISTPLVVQPDSKNVLTIDFCDLQLGKEKYSDLHVFDAADKVYKYHGFGDGNPWNTSVQYKNNIVARDTFSSGGFKAMYKFIIEEDFDKSSMQAAVERSGLYTVSLNGTEIKPESGQWFLDRDIALFSIGQWVKKGENILSIELSPMKIHAEIEPVYILGDFTVQPAAKGWVIKSPAAIFSVGSWKSKGWPFYAGSVSYTTTVEIEHPATYYRVSLGNWNGTVAEVLVNGNPAGIIGFEPYTLDVSKWIQAGKNTVTVKIIGSNKNLLGPFHNNPGTGLTSPWHFRNVKSYPSGHDYHQLDYGLMENFYLESGK